MTPKKLAVFVEGQTEQIFLQRLLREIAGQQEIAIEPIKFFGSGPSRVRTMTSRYREDASFYAQIIDCHGGGEWTTVVSDIRDHYQGLVREGFSLVLGVRDVYPVPMDRYLQLREGIQRALPRGRVPVAVILAVREIEAWFVAEDRHYEVLNRTLTPHAIKRALHIDVVNDPPESFTHPADLLNRIYRLRNMSYKKSRADVMRTVEALDYDYLSHGVAEKSESLAQLCKHLRRFFHVPA